MLLDDFQIIHICGKDKIDNKLLEKKGYIQFEYVKNELKDFFALADLVVSRAGANSICELLALQKPNLLIPLSANQSRGDQLQNARSFESQGFSMVIDDDDLTTLLLVDKIHELFFSRSNYIKAMEQSSQINSVQTIIDLIEEEVNK
jgi:UDP-N-acetylglucosamine--N-acetylmuramyl-(pentapeptide) pyrophosphoryl-undecaprenol N-acetylglucosamine transferase